jgi:hypothetical protein
MAVMRNREVGAKVTSFDLGVLAKWSNCMGQSTC